MSIKIGDFLFEGPFNEINNIEDYAGVYVIIDYRNNEYKLLDCGESLKIKSRILNNCKNNIWDKCAQGELMYAVFYTAERFEVEKKIRNKFFLPCSV